MDPGFTTQLANPLGLQALYCTAPQSIAEARSNALPFLRNRKMAKFMGKQDFMAVSAAGEAIAAAALSSADLQNETGLYLCTGYIPFEEDDIAQLALNSQENGQLSMQRFSTDGVNNVNPLMTFRCLPNMPAFHISVNFEIMGPSFTSYPGTGQLYSALEQAIADLESGLVKHALIGAVADQKNFLVENFYQRLNHQNEICDSAFFMILSKKSAKFCLTALELFYTPTDLLLNELHKTKNETIADNLTLTPIKKNLGASLTGFQLLEAIGTYAQKINLQTNTFDGYKCSSEWRQL